MSQQPTGEIRGGVEDDVKRLYWLFGIVGVILAVAFITLIIQYFVTTATTFQNLNDQILIQNGKIEMLTNEIHRQKGFR